MVTSFLNRFAPIDFTRYIDRLTDRFTGREWLFEKHINPWLEKENSNEQFYLLTGEPGVGKSAIVAELIKRWQTQPGDEEQGRLAAYHFCRAGDVETVRPGRVLRSIAAQLGKTLPHYGKALNKVLEQVHLKIDVNINIDTLSNSQVTGIYIENLKDLDPREELRLLLQAPLAELPKIYKDLTEEERAKLPELPTLKVFLIDSLDEAVTTTGRDNVATLIAALSQANDLPPWIRFILTARPGILKASPGSDTALQFQSLKHYELGKLLAENLTDIERYVTRRVQEDIERPQAAFTLLWQGYRELQGEQTVDSERLSLWLIRFAAHLITKSNQPKFNFQTRLGQAELSAETLVDKVTKLSNGNFLYTRLVMDGIGTGELSLKNLSALPKNLYEVYQRFLRHRCSVRKWIHLYQPLLGTLTVTQEAISSAQLAKFAKVASDQVEGVSQVEGAIAILQQFLDEIENDEGQKLYTIFHQSLREYLLDRKHNHDFWCDGKEQHDNIIECCEKESEGWQNLRAIDLYGLRHLAQHLVKGDRIEELHTLLSLEKDSKNAWFKSKDDVAETAGFLVDVELAWAQVDEAYERKPEKSVGLQCRYALIKTSVNSLVALPAKLMAALVKHYQWKPDKALAYSCLILDSEKRCEALTLLADQLPTSEALKFQFVECALRSTQTIQNGSACSLALRRLAEKLTPALLPQALEVIQAIQDDSARAGALVALVDKLAPELLPQALEVALSVQDVYYRSQALTALANHLPELVPQALEVALSVQDDFNRLNPFWSKDTWSNRAEVLISLAHQLTPDLLPQALETALTIESDFFRAKVLAALADKLIPSLLPQALKAALAIQDDFSRFNVLSALANKLPDVLPQALESALAIQNSKYRAEALTALADKLPNKLPDILSQALESALAIQDSYYYAEALTALALADKFSDILPQALKAVLAIQDDYSRAKILTSLADKLPDVLPLAIESALAVPAGDCFRAEVLTLLADKLPDMLPQALEAALAIQDDYYRAEALISLTSKLPQHLLPQALEAAWSIEDNYHRAQVLIAIADKLPYLLPQALEAALAIQDDYYRAQVLIAIADKLPYLLPIAHKAALSIQNAYHRTEALASLSNKIPDTLPQALNAALSIQDNSACAHFLEKLAEKLSPTLLLQALENTSLIQDDYYRAEAVKSLSIYIFKLPNHFKLWKNALHSLSCRTRPNLLSDIVSLTPILISLEDEFAIADTVRAIQDVTKWWP